MGKSTTILAVFLLLISAIQSTASAQTIYTLSRSTGNVYAVNSLSNASTFLGSIDVTAVSTPNIDLTYFEGFLYGLVSGDRNNSVTIPPQLIRIDPVSGALDTSFGVDGIQTLTLSNSDQMLGVAEGIANDTNNLVIIYRAATTSSTSSNTISTFSTGGVEQVTGIYTENLLPTNNTGRDRDADGLGMCSGRAISVDTTGASDRGDNEPVEDIVEIFDFGTVDFTASTGVYNLVQDYTPSSPASFGDITFIGDARFVVAGTLPSSTIGGTPGLHFFDFIGTTVTYISSVAVIDPTTGSADLGIYSVASATEPLCVLPTEVLSPDYPTRDYSEECPCSEGSCNSCCGKSTCCCNETAEDEASFIKQNIFLVLVVIGVLMGLIVGLLFAVLVSRRR